MIFLQNSGSIKKGCNKLKAHLMICNIFLLILIKDKPDVCQTYIQVSEYY
jgi:hypothetical protein